MHVHACIAKLITQTFKFYITTKDIATYGYLAKQVMD